MFIDTVNKTVATPLDLMWRVFGGTDRSTQDTIGIEQWTLFSNSMIEIENRFYEQIQDSLSYIVLREIVDDGKSEVK